MTASQPDPAARREHGAPPRPDGRYVLWVLHLRLSGVGSAASPSTPATTHLSSRLPLEPPSSPSSSSRSIQQVRCLPRSAPVARRQPVEPTSVASPISVLALAHGLLHTSSTSGVTEMTKHRDLAAATVGIDRELRDGRLEQCCPTCGRWEAAGPYCTWCSRPSDPMTWYRNADVVRRAAIRWTVPAESFCPEMHRSPGAGKGDNEYRRTPPKRPRGRPRKSESQKRQFAAETRPLHVSGGTQTRPTAPRPWRRDHRWGTDR